MGIVRDVTIDNLTQAVQGISSTGISDITGQAINNTIDTLGKDTTLQTVSTQLNNVNLNLINVKDAINNLGSAISPSANNVTYDNTTSGLNASNVQSAIDEICTDLFQTKTYTTSYTAGGNASISITADDFNATTPSGYTPIGIGDFASQNVNVVVRGVYGRATGTSTMMSLRNVTSTSVTATAYITILYIKTSFL